MPCRAVVACWAITPKRLQRVLFSTNLFHTDSHGRAFFLFLSLSICLSLFGVCMCALRGVATCSKCLRHLGWQMIAPCMARIHSQGHYRGGMGTSRCP